MVVLSDPPLHGVRLLAFSAVTLKQRFRLRKARCPFLPKPSYLLALEKAPLRCYPCICWRNSFSVGKVETGKSWCKRTAILSFAWVETVPVENWSCLRGRGWYRGVKDQKRKPLWGPQRAEEALQGRGLQKHSLCLSEAPSWCLEQTASQSPLQVRWPASVLTHTDTIENCIRRWAIGICSKYITEHKWLADTACLAVCKGSGSMDFWIRREGLFFLCAGTSSWWLGRKLI